MYTILCTINSFGNNEFILAEYTKSLKTSQLDITTGKVMLYRPKVYF